MKSDIRNLGLTLMCLAYDSNKHAWLECGVDMKLGHWSFHIFLMKSLQFEEGYNNL